MESFIGGIIIGVSVMLMFLFNGKLIGNSSIVSGLFTLVKDKMWWRLFYLIGLMLGVIVFRLSSGESISYELNRPYAVIIIAGLLVGFGTRLGSGCTSGHGICGIARFSKRSIVATIVFMITGMVTVFIYQNVFPGGF